MRIKNILSNSDLNNNNNNNIETRSSTKLAIQWKLFLVVKNIRFFGYLNRNSSGSSGYNRAYIIPRKILKRNSHNYGKK